MANSRSISPYGHLGIALAGLGGIAAVYRDAAPHSSITLGFFTALVLAHAAVGLLVALGKAVRHQPLLGTLTWLLELVWYLLVWFGYAPYPVVATRLNSRGLGLPICLFFHALQQASARVLLPTPAVLSLAMFHTYLRHYCHMQLLTAEPRWYDSHMVWQILLAVLPHFLDSWWRQWMTKWPGRRQPSTQQHTTARPAPAEGPSKPGPGTSSVAPDTTSTSTSTIPIYVSPAAKTMKVCIRIRTNIRVASLPPDTSQHIHHWMSEQVTKVYGEDAHVRNVAIRQGSLIIIAELDLPHEAVPTIGGPVDLSWLCDGVLPNIVSSLPQAVDTPCVPTDITEVQIGDKRVHVSWDDVAQVYRCTGITLVQPDDMDAVRLGLVWARPTADVQPTTSMPHVTTAGSKVQLQVQVLGAGSCAGDWQLVGSSPAGGEVSTGKQGAQESAAMEAGGPEAHSQVLQLWVHSMPGYQQVTVLGVTQVRELQSVMALIEVDIPDARLLRHHLNGPPACLQFLTLELWRGSILLSSSKLVVGAPHIAPAPIPNCFWGTPPSLAAAAVSELHGWSQQLWNTSLSAQSMDREAAHSCATFTTDLATCLRSVVGCAVTSSCCVSATACNTHETLQALVGLPPSVFAASLPPLISFASAMQLHQVLRLLHWQLSLPCVKFAMRTHDAAGAQRATAPHVNPVPTAVLRPATPPLLQRLYASCVGYSCPACERLYERRVQLFTTPLRMFIGFMHFAAMIAIFMSDNHEMPLLPVILAATWGCCHITQALLLTLATSSPRITAITSSLYLTTAVLHIISLLRVYCMPGSGDLPVLERTRYNRVWVVHVSYVCVTEYVPLHGIVSAASVTWLTVLAGVLSFVTWPSHGVGYRALGSAVAAVLLPLLADMHLRRRLIMDSSGSSSSRSQDARQAAGGTANLPCGVGSTVDDGGHDGGRSSVAATCQQAPSSGSKHPAVKMD